MWLHRGLLHKCYTLNDRKHKRSVWNCVEVQFRERIRSDTRLMPDSCQGLRYLQLREDREEESYSVTVYSVSSSSLFLYAGNIHDDTHCKSWDEIHTHLSSSCIISSYFWMTLTPSADSKHLQRGWNFIKHAKVVSHISPSAIIPKHHFYEAFKAAHRAFNSHQVSWRSMTKAELFS